MSRNLKSLQENHTPSTTSTHFASLKGFHRFQQGQVERVKNRRDLNHHHHNSGGVVGVDGDEELWLEEQHKCICEVDGGLEYNKTGLNICPPPPPPDSTELNKYDGGGQWGHRGQNHLDGNSTEILQLKVGGVLLGRRM